MRDVKFASPINDLKVQSSGIMINSVNTPWYTKGPTLFWTTTPMFPGGFLQFFYQWKQELMLHGKVTKFTTYPQLCFRTTC